VDQAARPTGTEAASFAPKGCHPFTLRMMIWPDASRAQNSIAAVSAEGSTVWVLIHRLNFFSISALSVKSSLRSSQWLDPCGVAAGQIGLLMVSSRG